MANKGDIELQVKLWKRNKSSYPAANLSDIGADVSYFPGSLPVCPGRRQQHYTIDTNHWTRYRPHALARATLQKKLAFESLTLLLTYVT